MNLFFYLKKVKSTIKYLLIAELIFLHVIVNAQTKDSILIYFDFNKYTIRREHQIKLDSIFMNRSYKNVFIKTSCDIVGSNEVNDRLSSNRAASVKNYISKLLPWDCKISIESTGKRFPINQNRDSVERALNRRALILFFPERTDIKVDSIKIIPEKNSTASEPVVDSTKTSKNSFDIEQMEVGTIIRLKNLLFYGGRHKLLPSSFDTLDSLLMFMKNNTTVEIAINGYICCLNSPNDGFDFDTRTYNLSVNRAKFVYDYLVNHGISTSRLSYKGYGARNKISSEETEEGMELNRRVEIVVKKK